MASDFIASFMASMVSVYVRCSTFSSADQRVRSSESNSSSLVARSARVTDLRSSLRRPEAATRCRFGSLAWSIMNFFSSALSFCSCSRRSWSASFSWRKCIWCFCIQKVPLSWCLSMVCFSVMCPTSSWARRCSHARTTPCSASMADFSADDTMSATIWLISVVFFTLLSWTRFSSANSSLVALAAAASSALRRSSLRSFLGVETAMSFSIIFFSRTTFCLNCFAAFELFRASLPSSSLRWAEAFRSADDFAVAASLTAWAFSRVSSFSSAKSSFFCVASHFSLSVRSFSMSSAHSFCSSRCTRFVSRSWAFRSNASRLASASFQSESMLTMPRRMVMSLPLCDDVSTTRWVDTVMISPLSFTYCRVRVSVL
mmetsp:Transcript_20452/g.53220  ORF Transcript_20452/g.53220 Transcript_20452/m.53220 type:complete len:372 (+) Transcript_20452:1747-2862(+)